LTYSHDMMLQVTRPARYTGAEWNSIRKNWESTALRFALTYPDVYEVGMSNMALPIIYDLLNRQPDVLAERVYAPWIDMASAMQARGIPLASLESRRPLKDFDFVGFSLGYELTYTNVLNMLHLAQIPLLAAERNDAHPVIIAGGSCALNPEPMADFIDFFVIGDGEEVVLELVNCLRDCKGRGKRGTRKELLLLVAAIRGIYVPSLYQAEYQSDGRLKSIAPTVAEARRSIQQRIVHKLPPPVTSPVVPYIEVVHDRGAIEISRGCSRGCRFCNAGNIYRPVRERPQEEIITAAGELIANCGYDEISLVSLSTSDYTEIDKLVAKLAQRYHDQPLTLSVPSLRPDSSSVRLINALPSRKKTGLTFAPEAGSARLQRVINKVTAEDALTQAITTAIESGWSSLKLYFMVGLPTETAEDVDSIAQMVNRIHSLGDMARGKRPNIRVSLSTFVPKAHTPFQWVAQESEQQLDSKHDIIRKGLRRKGIRLSWNDPKTSLLEAALSRGDRRLGKVIYRAWQLGSVFDSWSEQFNYDNWLRAFDETGLDPAFYAQRERSQDELLPWAHIETGVTTAFMKQEYQRARQGTETPNCRHNDCNACGLERRQPECKQKLGKLSQN